jgi:hypothetical protein
MTSNGNGNGNGNGDWLSILLLLLSFSAAPVFAFGVGSPIFAATFLSMFVATGFYKFIEIKDPQGLDMEFPVAFGGKASAKMTGAIATFLVFGMLAWWGLTWEQAISDNQKKLDIVDNGNNDDYSVFFKPNNVDNRNNDDAGIFKIFKLNNNGQVQVGTIELYDKLITLRKINPFSDVFDKIQSDCPFSEDGDRKGLCGIPHNFEIKIIGFSNTIKNGEAIVCSQKYRYLVGNTYQISLDKNQTNPIKVNMISSATTPECQRASDPLHPSLVVGVGTLNQIDYDKNYYAKISE